MVARPAVSGKGPPPASARQQASALVIVLLFLTLISGVVVAFLLTARIERGTSRAHFDRARAAQYAAMGSERSIAILRQATAAREIVRQPDGSTRQVYRNYLTQPGGLLIPGPPAPAAREDRAASGLTKFIDLSSGNPTGREVDDSVFDPVELNIPTFRDPAGKRLLTDQLRPADQKPNPMRLRWIYLREHKHGQPGNPAAWALAYDPEERPVTSDKDRPIIGRFAFWVDDESTKLNYNLAWKRDPGTTPSVHSNPSRPSHPSTVNTLGLKLRDGSFATEAMADALFRWRDRSPNRPFNTFADARQVDPALQSLLEDNKFELTHYNHDPDTNYRGEGRILLTTKRHWVPLIDGQLVRPFLDILRDDVPSESLDPGLLDDLAGGQQDWRAGADGRRTVPNKFDAVVRELAAYLRAENWPVAPGSSFLDKYYPDAADDDPRIAQLAVNIIDYVRAKESPQLVVPPLHYGRDAAGRFTLHADYAAPGKDGFQGIGRAPYITEMAFSVGAEPVTMPAGATTPPAGWPVAEGSGEPLPLYPCTLKVEVYLPTNYNIADRAGRAGFDLAPIKSKPFAPGSAKCWHLVFDESFLGASNYYAEHPAGQRLLKLKDVPTHALPILPADVSGKSGTALQPGKYVVLTKVFYRREPHGEAPTALLRCGLYQGVCGTDGLLATPLERWLCANVAPRREPLQYPIADPKSTAPADAPSFETDDPRCNLHRDDWAQNSSGRNSFGLVNSRSTLGSPPTQSAPGQPQQDTDTTGLLTDASAYMPYPSGAGANGETGDAGRVTSVGELGFINTGANAAAAGVPWRSLRLQPSNYPNATVVPDWALLDLFTVLNTSSTKVKEPENLFIPHRTNVGGRVNLNAHVAPFDNLERLSALRAVFTGARGLRQKSDATGIAANIFQHTLADGSNRGKYFGSDPADAKLRPFFELSGEVCEIKGVADSGEKSEDLVRHVASLLITRGGVFGIYTVGQALVQTPHGGLRVVAEHRQHTLVERFIDPRGTPNPDADEVRFRPIYTRSLNP